MWPWSKKPEPVYKKYRRGDVAYVRIWTQEQVQGMHDVGMTDIEFGQFGIVLECLDGKRCYRVLVGLNKAECSVGEGGDLYVNFELVGY